MKPIDETLDRLRAAAPGGWILLATLPILFYGLACWKVVQDLLSFFLVTGGLFAIEGLILLLFLSRFGRPYQASALAVIGLLDGRDPLEGVPVPPRPVELEAARLFQQLKKLSGEKLWSELEIKKAEIWALQSQINPHFLYNTLESIRGQALWDGMDEIADTTEALSLFFRYGISQKGNTVTVRDELKSIGYYFRVLKYRFDDRFEFLVTIDGMQEEILSCEIPKLILQPVVENAVIHGLEPKSGPGRVEVKLSRTERTLIIQVNDNGMGIEPEVLARLQERMAQVDPGAVEPSASSDSVHTGIAVENVNSRIRVRYGPGFGLYLTSVARQGTSAEIVLPWQPRDAVQP